MSVRPSLRSALGRRTLVADGGMGTMLQGFDLSADDFGGYEGCNEWLNLTRPEVVTAIHRTYLDAGADLIETNTFGANLTALAEYGLADRIEELAEAGARLARQAADEASTSDWPRWVLGSAGPGTKLPTLGQISYTELRDGYFAQVKGLIRGGVDAVMIETCQDLLAVRAGVAGAKRAVAEAGIDLPILVSVTMETTGTMLVGSDLTAVVASLTALGIDGIGLNCATGPDGMRDHLRQLAAISGLPLSCLPNAGMPVLTEQGAYYPLTPDDFAEAVAGFVDSFGLSLVGGCCGTTPDHIAALVKRLGQRDLGRTPTAPEAVNSVASLYTATALTQDVSYLSIGERANAAGSRAFREALLAGDWDRCVAIARGQLAEGAHVIDLCVDYVGRDGKADMAELAGRIAREVDAPIQLDSSDPEVLRVGLELVPGRAIVNSVNFESGDGHDSKFARTMAQVREHGAAVVGLCIDEQGQARTVEAKLAVARRLITTLTSQYGMSPGDIMIDCLTYPIATGQQDVRRDAANTIDAVAALRTEFPAVHTLLGISNVSFGLKPAARVVLNSVFLDQCRQAGLDCAIVPAATIRPLDAIPAEQVEAALDLIWDRMVTGGTPLERFMALFDTAPVASATAAESLPVEERLRRHILDGSALDLDRDLAEALGQRGALEIINQDLLGAMREVGERFGSGKMQLPFVLKSAEVMKKAVNFLEPHLDRAEGLSKGTLVLATVRGDVHDIGKNLVDIILTNNGYKVVNLGIKQPIADIISSAETVGADAIGLSGLLVKSTQVMRENLEELNARGLAEKYPVLLGGAALTRSFVEDDLNQIYSGEVRYARDAFEGLALMDAVMARQTGTGDLPAARARRVVPTIRPAASGVRSEVTRPVPDGVDVPTLPFLGPRQGRAGLAEVLPWLDKRALFAGQWGLKAAVDGPSYEELVAEEGEPRLARWLERITDENLVDFQVVWGYWPCHSEGDDLVVEDTNGLVRFNFPRQSGGDHLCLADYFRDEVESAQWGPDVVGFQLVTAGATISCRTAQLFEADAYRDYFELHGLGVQLAEAFAEMWHDRVRNELGLAALTDDKAAMVARQRYQGERFSFGYPACPDLAQRRPLVDLLKPERIGVALSDQYQLDPEQSTDAMIVHHPQAHYFSAR